MSFGQYEYQHRFYRNEPHLKVVTVPNNESNVLPLWSSGKSPVYYTPQVGKHADYGNNLNLKVRAGEIGYNQPGWQGYRLKSYVTDKYSQNYQSYQNDRDMIEKFKREAEEQKRRRRFAGREYAYENRVEEPVKNLPQIRMRTQEPQQPRQYSPEPCELPRIEENPQVHENPNRYDVGIMARMQTQSRQKYYQSRYKQMKKQQQRKKLREYKKKYSKLKSKLKEQLMMQHQFQNQSLSKREEVEEQNISRIQSLITDVSERIAKNAVIFNEGLRVERELQAMRERSPSPTPVSFQSLPTVHKETYQTQPPEPLQAKQPSPRIVYNPKGLSNSYLQLQRLKGEITTINKRIQNNYRQL